MKSVESTPAPSVTSGDQAQPATTIPMDEAVAPLSADIETFTSLRDKLVQRMRDEIQAAEEKLAELNQQFATLFPELASDDQPAPKPKKSKPKPAVKTETPVETESSNEEDAGIAEAA